MAIEFNCPYCTATIRVPDAYAGKQGRCPKCDTKLLIPSAPVPDPAEIPRLPLGKTERAAENPAAPPAVDEFPIVSNGNVAAGNELFAVRPVTTSVVKSRRRNVRRRPSRALVIGVPVICFLVLFGIIAYSLTGSLPQLRGELTARALDGVSRPKTVIPWGEIGLSEDDRKTLQEALTTQPESLASQFMSCRLSASDDGLVVMLAAQPTSEWIVVNVAADQGLAIWRRKEGPQFDRMRRDELRATVTQYAKDKLLKINGEQIAIDAASVRDKVALNASCRSLSYAIQAVADAAIFPCAGEDDLGQLYFCLPKSVQAFRIQGRSLTNGMIGFKGDYSVLVSGEKVTTDPTPVTDDPKTEMSLPEDEPETPGADPPMSGPDEDMKNVTPKADKSDEKAMSEKPMMKAE